MTDAAVTPPPDPFAEASRCAAPAPVVAGSELEAAPVDAAIASGAPTPAAPDPALAPPARPAAHDDASAAAPRAAGTTTTPPEVAQVGSLWVVRWRRGRWWRMESGFTSREDAEFFAATRASTPATPPPPVLIGPGNGARAAAIASRSGAANDVAPTLALVAAAPAVEVSRPAPAPNDVPFEFPRDQLDRLKPAIRRIVELRLEGLAVREIGARLGLAMGSVTYALKRARGLPSNEVHAAYLARAARASARHEAGEEESPEPQPSTMRAPRACKICRQPGHNATTCSQRLRGLDRLMAIEAAADRLYGRVPPPAAAGAPLSPGPESAPSAGDDDATLGQVSRSADDDTDFSEFLPAEAPALAAPVDAFAVQGESPWDPGEPANDASAISPTIERARKMMADRDHPEREKHSRGITLSALHMGRDEKRAAGLVLYPEDVERPLTRGDCADMPRPCPFVSCAHHLYLDVGVAGALKLNFPDREVWEMRETCSLDVADRGGVVLDEVGEFLGITRERVRQVEEAATERGRRWLEKMERASSEKVRSARAAG